ncbi:MAG: putative glycolipid-binding domain-containing protein, partial [Actinomycetota bacterium]|nr:putative glycolipid-binding domain-containing protein [Actinomycetota bacterium]
MMRVWAKDQPFGAELANLTLSGESLSATGVALGSEPCPYRLDYQLTTTEGYVTAQLIVRTEGPGWRRALVLQRAASGTWSCV